LISWSIAALPGAKSEPRYLVLIGTDITERRQTETALQASETAFRQSGAQLQTLTSGLITAQEEERKRISRDLHDDISQKLTALTVEMEAVMRKQDGAGKSSVTLRALRDRLSEVSEDVRRTAYELHPSSLEHLGLATALRSYCSDFQRHEGIVVRFTPRNVPRHIPSNVSLSMYRMVQEALHNVSKHSGARQAAVSLAGRHGGLTLRVKDSGRGFDPARARGRGLGLISMEERAHLAGGTFDIRARPGEGVRIEVHVPLSSPRKRALKSLRPW
jgi:signal transduction histidine kinase